jgi:hypothetical protein
VLARSGITGLGVVRKARMVNSAATISASANAHNTTANMCCKPQALGATAKLAQLGKPAIPHMAHALSAVTMGGGISVVRTDLAVLANSGSQRTHHLVNV